MIYQSPPSWTYLDATYDQAGSNQKGINPGTSDFSLNTGLFALLIDEFTTYFEGFGYMT